MAAIAPADAFRAGSNRVDVFVVRGRGSGRTLAAVTTNAGTEYRLVERDGVTAIEGDGRRTEVRKGRLAGYVDRFLRDDQGVRLGGWAADLVEHRPAERILVFAGDRLVGQGEPSLERPDVATNLGANARQSGYEVRVPLEGGDPGALRVFAVSGGAAAELPRWKG